MSRRLPALFVALALLGGGCRCNPERHAEDAAASDAVASQVDAALATVDPLRLRPVALMTRYNADFGTTTSVDHDGTIYVASGGMAYEARDGALTPILPVRRYVSTMQEERVPLLGFEGDDDPIAHIAKDARGALRLFGEHHEWPIMPGAEDGGAASAKKLTVWSPMAFRGGMITRDYERGLGWIGSEKGEGGPTFRAKPAPPGKPHYSDVTVAVDGTLVAPVGGLPQVAIWRRGVPLDAGEIVVLGTAPDGGHEYRECRVAPSFDLHVYVCCETSTIDAHAPTLHRLDGARFVEAFPGIIAGCSPAPSIDRAGNLYHVGPRLERDAPARLDRCTPTGSCERVEIDVPDVRKPHYSLYFEQVRNEHGARWFELGIGEDGIEKELWISAVYARAPDDVWVVGSGAIFHNRGAARPGALLGLPTRVDARVRAQNEHPPVTWTKDCDSVFIELAAGARVDAGADADQAKIAEVLGKRGPPVAWKLVTGHLYDRDVAGVVVWRNEYDWKRDKMNAAIDQFVEAFTRDPMNVPKVYCTLPVLSRVVQQSP